MRKLERFRRKFLNGKEDCKKINLKYKGGQTFAKGPRYGTARPPGWAIKV